MKFVNLLSHLNWFNYSLCNIVFIFIIVNLSAVPLPLALNKSLFITINYYYHHHYKSERKGQRSRNITYKVCRK